MEQEGVARDVETFFKTKNGSDVPVEITANVLFDREGHILGYEGIVRDITASKRSEEIIGQTHRELAAINAINIASSSLGLEDMLKRTLEVVCKLLDIDSARIYLVDETGGEFYLVVSHGLSEAFVEKKQIRIRDVGQGLLGQVMSSGKEMVFSDLTDAPTPFRNYLINEGLKSAAYFPLISKGNILGVIVATSHVGHRFTAREGKFLSAVGKEVGLAVENVLLYEQTHQALRELKSTQKQLIHTEKLASLGKMSAIFAHEINNPIAAILTYAKLMDKILKKPDLKIDERLPDILRYLETMQHETARCGEIVKNLLTFARESSPKIEGNSLEKILKRTIPLISHELELKNITLKLDIPNNLPLIKCDFKQIQQALLNIMINASEAMQQGGTLTVTARRAYAANMVKIDITDTGHGIPQEQLRNIFEPFFTTKGEGKGVGLGLAVVYGIITRHGGQIQVKSREGEGTTFTIQLPLQE